MPPSLLFDLSQIDLRGKPIFDKEAIGRVNPQRFEMQQLDGVLWYDKEKFLILGYKDVTEDEFWIRGHIPGRPLMPAVIMVEAAAQLSGFFVKQVYELVGFIGFAGIDSAKFRAVVEPGQLYRSGYLEPRPLHRVIREHKLKTILALLNNEPDTPEHQTEDKVACAGGVKLIRIGMPGDGCGDFDALDRAADVIADPANRPLLVHCAAGVHRTGAAYAAYRMKHCGWELDKALAEGEKYGYPITGKPALVAHLREYYQTRVRGNE